MQTMNQYYWAQDKVEDVVAGSKQHRETQACERRLKQLQKQRDKNIKRSMAIVEKEEQNG